MGFEFPSLSAIIPETEAHRIWLRNVTENTEENSTKDIPRFFRKTERKVPGSRPAGK